MDWKKSLAIWLVIMLLEITHGILRRLFVNPVIGEHAAHQAGVVVGSLLVFIVTVSTIRWLDVPSFADQLKVGALWVVATVVFEWALGVGLGTSWERLLSDYDVAQGGLMGLGLLFMLFAPALAAKARGAREATG